MTIEEKICQGIEWCNNEGYHDDEAINDAANIFSDSYDEYNAISDALERHFSGGKKVKPLSPRESFRKALARAEQADLQISHALGILKFRTGVDSWSDVAEANRIADALEELLPIVKAFSDLRCSE